MISPLDIHGETMQKLGENSSALIPRNGRIFGWLSCLHRRTSLLSAFNNVSLSDPCWKNRKTLIQTLCLSKRPIQISWPRFSRIGKKRNNFFLPQSLLLQLRSCFREPNLSETSKAEGPHEHGLDGGLTSSSSFFERFFGSVYGQFPIQMFSDTHIDESISLTVCKISIMKAASSFPKVLLCKASVDARWRNWVLLKR